MVTFNFSESQHSDTHPLTSRAKNIHNQLSTPEKIFHSQNPASCLSTSIVSGKETDLQYSGDVRLQNKHDNQSKTVTKYPSKKNDKTYGLLGDASSYDSDESDNCFLSLPVEVLESIFYHLPLVDIYTLTSVCRQWYNIIHRPNVSQSCFFCIVAINHNSTIQHYLPW